jgi:hypothetical protein
MDITAECLWQWQVAIIERVAKMAAANIKDVMNFFEIPIATFSKEWKELSDKDKADLREGIGDGTLSY